MNGKNLNRQRFLFRLLLISLLTFGVSSSFALAHSGVQVRFDLSNPTGGPFPSNLFTVPDPSHNTNLRVNLPKPDCAVWVTDCQNIDVINTLDGFNLQPRLSIPFTGPIDVNTVTSETVFLIRLGSLTRGKVIGINQAVWDPATNTLHVESDELLEQHTRYALIVTRQIRDMVGKPIGASEAFVRFLAGLDFGQMKNPAVKAYRYALLNALATTLVITRIPPLDIVAASVFTTQSTTAVLEKIRDQIKADTPDPADFLLGPGGSRTVFPLSNVTDVTHNNQFSTTPAFSPAPVPTGAFGPFPDKPFRDAVGYLAFGKYFSPDYETAGKFIPPVGTLSGVPAVQGENEIFFNLYLPSGQKPRDGWPVTIFGHGAGENKNFSSGLVAATLAAQGIATIAINGVGNGGGPLSTLTVNQVVGGPVTFSAGGRSIDQNGDTFIVAGEGRSAAPPRGIIGQRDGLQQTVVDLMQLVREIEVGMDVDGDGISDLDSSRIYTVRGVK